MYACATAGDAGLKLYRTDVLGPAAGGKRGNVVGFSRASRRRLIDKLLFLPWADCVDKDRHRKTTRLCLITLTYPARFPLERREYKRDLDNFNRALKRARDGQVSAFWRLEFQRRGAPHYHILALFDTDVDVGRLGAWCRKTWYRVVASGDARHLEHGADVRAVYQPKSGRGGLVRYLVKYLGKVDESLRECGRCWGEWGEMPEVVRAALVFECRQGFVEFLRRVRKWGKKSAYLRRIHSVTGLRLFGDGLAIALSLGRGLEGVNVYVT